jgi:hypothetical protein
MIGRLSDSLYVRHTALATHLRLTVRLLCRWVSRSAPINAKPRALDSADGLAPLPTTNGICLSCAGCASR